ncbi:MAG: 2-hydroxyacyl-CoA dehydratase family protein [Dehalococcoidia bacterium]|nr:2-hydroxyacyl-CoA dehydratase family protein [Dehalococcoidia bacterium]
MAARETGTYKTRPFESWKLAKELRMNHYREVADSRTEGGKKLLVGGGTESWIGLPAGLGDYVFLGGEPYAASMSASDPAFAIECMEVTEAAGYARDLCAYMRNYFGSLILDRYFFGGPFPKADFYLQSHICDTHAKWYQIVSEMVGVPYHPTDFVPYLWDESEEGKHHKIDFLAGQLLDTIDWMVEVTGREYHDELLIEAVKNEFRCTSLWAQCAMLNQNIPAPMDEKTMYSFYILAVLIRHRPEAVRFYETLLDELKYRVANRIAAVPTERFRILHDSQPPWYALHIFRYLEKFGVVCVGANYEFGLSGGWDYKKGEYLRPAVPPQDRGIVLKNREDACRALSEWWLEGHLIARCIRFSGSGKNNLILQTVKDWKCDGLMVHLNRGCEGVATGQMEVRGALAEAGVPVMTYEGNVGDSREFDEARTLARIDAFMESVGLRMTED